MMLSSSVDQCKCGPGGALTPPGLAPKECTFEAGETVSVWSGRLAADDPACALLREERPVGEVPRVRARST